MHVKDSASPLRRINITVPVYNEETILETSIRTLVTYLEESAFPYPYRIRIVDNASTDLTPAIAAALARDFPCVEVLSLSEKGKGRAVKAGWDSDEEILSFMDADLSSDLRYFRELIDAVADGSCALAIGNRLGARSHIVGRRRVRELASRIYNFLARFFCHSSATDHQCGFKAMSRAAYGSVRHHLVNDTWFFDTELVVEAERAGLLRREIDITWVDRRASKVTLTRTSHEMLLALLQLRARLEKRGIRDDRRPGIAGQVARFLASGGVVAGVNLAFFFLCTEILQLGYVGAVLVASLASFLTSFTLQKFWTFADPSVLRAPLQLTWYACSAAVTAALNIVLVALLVEAFTIWPTLAQAIALALIAAGNFFVYKFLIFRIRPAQP